MPNSLTCPLFTCQRPTRETGELGTNHHIPNCPVSLVSHICALVRASTYSHINIPPTPCGIKLSICVGTCYNLTYVSLSVASRSSSNHVHINFWSCVPNVSKSAHMSASKLLRILITSDTCTLVNFPILLLPFTYGHHCPYFYIHFCRY